MNHLLRCLLSGIIIIAIAASCSIQKRRYTRGWYVSGASHQCRQDQKARGPGALNRPAASKTSEIKTLQQVTASAGPIAKHAVERALLPEKKNFKAENSTAALPALKKPGHFSPVAANKFRSIAISASSAPSPGDDTTALSIIAFILGVLGFVLVLPAIPAIIIGGIALRRYRVNRIDDSKRIFALLGFIFGWIVIALVLIAILAVVLLVVLLGA